MRDRRGRQERAIVAGGCFWGVEYRLKSLPGVISTRVGYTGGHGDNPDYELVCSGTTDHAEAVEVLFDPTVLSFEQLAKRFFEIHDPTQKDRQGQDVGRQYRSEVFYLTDEQRATAEKLLDTLRERGFEPVTELTPAVVFWEAEEHHQDYFEKHRDTPVCHTCVNRFGVPKRL